MVNTNQEKWNTLHENPRYWPEYPSERVVQWAFNEFDREEGDVKILDHGCGTGRHTIFLKENGFDVEGCDVSKNGLEVAGIRTIGRNLEIPYTLFDGVTLPYLSESFDGLVSYGVLYYMDKDAVGVVIDEIKRVLKDSGKALVVVRSSTDSRNDGDVGRGDDIMDMIFFTEEELRHLFRGFSEIRIDKQTQTYGKEKDSDFVIQLVK